MAKRKGPGGNLGSSKKINHAHNNSISNQRKRLLDMLIERKYASTFYIRNTLEIMHPAGRIRELKIAHDIETLWTREPDQHGINHRVGLYVYHGPKTSQGEIHNVAN